MNRIGWSRILFGLAALYDAVLGVAFLVFPSWVFQTFNVTPPNHWGYVQFPAALLILFAIMFLAIACNPVGRRGLIPYGIGLKVAYCAISFAYWFGPGIPWMWKPFSEADLLMVVLFVWAYTALGGPRPQPAQGSGDE